MISLRNVNVYYDDLHAVKNFNMDVDDGEFVAVIGSSGSGKSSLLKSVNLLNVPRSGEIIYNQTDVTKLRGKELRDFRRKIGFVFQDYNIVESLTVLENVLLGRIGYKSTLKSLFGIYSDKEYELALSCIETVGLKEKSYVKARDLSGGQKQRVAIAKSLCQEPEVILADEPVSSLDSFTTENVLNYFKSINETKHIAIIINLHDVTLAKKYATRIVAIKDGEKVFDGKKEALNEFELKAIYQ